MSIEQKIVYAGLSRMTEDRVVIKNAFDYWQTNLSSNAFDIVEVTSQLVAFLGLSAGEKKVLMIAMHAASNKSNVELEDVPGYLLGSDAAAESVSESVPKKAVINTTPQHQITVGFVKGLCDGVRSNSASSFTELDDILRDEGLDGVSVAINQNIKQHGFSENILPSSISEEECRDLAHTLYMLIIEVIGPVEADNIVTNVIGVLKRSEMASRFDPSSLI